MHIEISTDRHVEGSADLRRDVTEQVTAALSRFGDLLTRVEVHLGDENAGKGGNTDMRCAMEARPAGQAALAVTHNAATLPEAYRGAAGKLQRLLETRFSRVDSRHGRKTIRYDDPN